MKLIIVVLIFFTISVTLGQEFKEKPNSLVYDGFSYADFGTGEEHSYFSISQRLNPQLHADIRGFYDTYVTANVFDLSFRIKLELSKKLYAFTGLGMQIQQVKIENLGVPYMPLRSTSGMGYKASESLLIEAVYDQNIHTAAKYPQLVVPKVMSIGGKYRF